MWFQNISCHDKFSYRFSDFYNLHHLFHGLMIPLLFTIILYNGKSIFGHELLLQKRRQYSACFSGLHHICSMFSRTLSKRYEPSVRKLNTVCTRRSVWSCARPASTPDPAPRRTAQKNSLTSCMRGITV